MRNLESLTESEIDFIVSCFQSFENSPYYKEDRDDMIMESIICKLR